MGGNVIQGCRMVEMSCTEHDKFAARSQFLTHTIGRQVPFCSHHFYVYVPSTFTSRKQHITCTKLIILVLKFEIKTSLHCTFTGLSTENVLEFVQALTVNWLGWAYQVFSFFIARPAIIFKVNRCMWMCISINIIDGFFFFFSHKLQGYL